VFTDARRTPGCGGEPNEPDSTDGNAFYCVPDDFVYADPGLLDDLHDAVGPLAPQVVVAHELAHRLQARTDSFPDTSLLVELQADCFAAAWARDAVDRGAAVPATTRSPSCSKWRC